MAGIRIDEVSKTSRVKILGHIFNGLADIKNAVEVYCNVGRETWETKPESSVAGIHVACVYKPYPCFDSEDYANENRDYSNYFFSTAPFTRQQIDRLANLPDRMNVQKVNDDMPQWAVPAVYYRGEGEKMTVATML